MNHGDFWLSCCLRCIPYMSCFFCVDICHNSSQHEPSQSRKQGELKTKYQHNLQIPKNNEDQKTASPRRSAGGYLRTESIPLLLPGASGSRHGGDWSAWGSYGVFQGWHHQNPQKVAVLEGKKKGPRLFPRNLGWQEKLNLWSEDDKTWRCKAASFFFRFFCLKARIQWWFFGRQVAANRKLPVCCRCSVGQK